MAYVYLVLSVFVLVLVLTGFVLVLSRDTQVYCIYVVFDFWFSSWMNVFFSTRINVVNVAL